MSNAGERSPAFFSVAEDWPYNPRMWWAFIGLLAAAPPAVAAPQPSLLLVTLDTTRVDRLGCYGANPSRTPQIDALAKRGVRFAQAQSPVPLTLPAHASLFTARTPREHGVLDNALDRLAPAEQTLAESLKRAGYVTLAAVGAAVLDRDTGIAQGFDRFDDRVRVGSREWFDWRERSAVQVNAAALSLLEGVDSPFFLWVHYYDPHHPYVPPEPFRSRWSGAPYDGEIAAMDDALGSLLAALKQRGLDRSLIVAVAGDHGESLGDHGEQQHGLFLYQSTQHVPLIVAGPGVPAARVVSPRVGLIDLAPTLLDLMKQAPLPAASGRSLLGLMRGSVTRWTSSYEMETIYPLHGFGWAPSTALVRGDDKWIAAPIPERYDLRRDPGETTNRSSGNDAARAAVPDAYARWDALVASAPTTPTSDADRQRLEELAALGYASGGTRPKDLAALPDTKTQIATLNQIDRAREDLAAGRAEAAITRLEPLLARDPHNPFALLTLGRALLGAGRANDAAARFAAAAEQTPNDAQAWFLLGGAERARGKERFDAAERALARAIELAPRHADAVLVLALVRLQKGDGIGARRVLDDADRRGVEDAELLALNATLARRMNDPSRALPLLDRALGLDPGHAPARLARAELRAEAGDRAGAIADYQELLRHGPSPTDAARIRDRIEKLQ
ncbi:MAG: sulfatase-like hydrolase/transferase [Acidobacteriota bacterium]